MEANVPSAANELCQVVVTPSTTHALRGVVNNVQVLFNVVTGHTEQDETKRPPINLAIVLDRSGSMDSKQKLKNAKLAIKKVVEALGEEDILHLVLYGSEIEVAFQNANVKEKQALLSRVDQVVTEGMTNMYAGLDKGAQVVKEYSKKGYTNRIFLFSDGLVNEGITDKRRIYHHISEEIYTNMDIKVSAFGLGDDFDEELMKSIAEHGSGAYFFIEGSATIPRFVDFALRGLFKLVGTDATLKIRGLNGATVTKIYSHKELTKPYKLDDLKQDDGRGVVCELQVTPSVQPSEEVLKWELEYRPSSNSDEALASHTVSIQGTLRINFTDDEQEVEKGQNPAVLAKVAIQKTGELDAELINLIGSGKTKEAIATTEQEIQLLRDALEKDVDGSANIAGHLKHVESALADLHREGASKSNAKKAHHRNYMKRRTSVCYDREYIEDAINTEQVDEATSPASSPPNSPPRGNRRSLRYS